MNAAPYLTTASGQRYRLTGPELDAPRIGDIAHHLAQINRFTGAASRPYSVAEHSLLCEHIAASEGAGPMARLCALMHDAHEAYTSDMASPAKRAMQCIAGGMDTPVISDFDQFEFMHHQHVLRSFGLLEISSQNEPHIKRWDLIALATERRDLMSADDGEGWEILRGVEPFSGGLIEQPSFSTREHWLYFRNRFMDKFNELNVRTRGMMTL